MKIEVPKNLITDFLVFLDIAQASYAEEDVRDFSASEKRVLKFVEGILGKKKSKRFITKMERAEVARNFLRATGRYLP